MCRLYVKTDYLGWKTSHLMPPQWWPAVGNILKWILRATSHVVLLVLAWHLSLISCAPDFNSEVAQGLTPKFLTTVDRNAEPNSQLLILFDDLDSTFSSLTRTLIPINSAKWFKITQSWFLTSTQTFLWDPKIEI